MIKNYYEEKLEEISILLKENNFKKVYEIIQEELKMPYIPEIYEKQFLETINDIKHYIVGDESPTSLSREIAMEYLISDDEAQECIALELLKEHNLRYEKEIIKQRIETWPIEKNMLKAFLFESLVEQEIDIDINFNGLKLNPKTTGTILLNKEVQKTMEEIPNYFEKNPAASNMALDEFQKFLLITYPAVPENGKEFAKDISQIIKSMFEDGIKLTDKQKRIKELLSK